MFKTLIVENKRRSPETSWINLLSEGLGSLIKKLEIRIIELEPTGAYQEQHYRNITEFVGSPQVMLKEIKDTEILIVGVAPVPDDVIAAGKNLKLIMCPRGGPVNVDIKAATEQKIPVVHSPGRNAESVVDHTFGLLISEVRHIARSYNALLQGNHDQEFRTWRFPLFELPGKTIGIVGFGRVGSLMAKRAKGFDMKILVFDPYVSEEVIRSQGAEKVDLETLLKNADIVSVHARLTPETRHLIGMKEFNFMKLVDKLPPTIARDHVESLLGGIISAKYLANLDSIGKGPKRMRVGRKVVYMTEDLLEWLESRSVNLN